MEEDEGPRGIEHSLAVCVCLCVCVWRHPPPGASLGTQGSAWLWVCPRNIRGGWNGIRDHLPSPLLAPSIPCCCHGVQGAGFPWDLCSGDSTVTPLR